MEIKARFRQASDYSPVANATEYVKPFEVSEGTTTKDLCEMLKAKFIAEFDDFNGEMPGEVISPWMRGNELIKEGTIYSILDFTTGERKGLKRFQKLEKKLENKHKYN